MCVVAEGAASAGEGTGGGGESPPPAYGYAPLPSPARCYQELRPAGGGGSGPGTPQQGYQHLEDAFKPELYRRSADSPPAYEAYHYRHDDPHAAADQ